jgi:four helix bundle protein
VIRGVEGGGWSVLGDGRFDQFTRLAACSGGEERQMAVQSYRQLDVWRFAMELAENCYRVTKGFPKEEMFGFTSQIRRASASIPANIAEGQGRDHTKEFLHHLSIARGSLMELETHLQLSQRVGLLEGQDVEKLLELSDRISRMLSGLRNKLLKRVQG